MNYDGEAYVKNILEYRMTNINGRAFVLEDVDNFKELAYTNKYKDSSWVITRFTSPKKMEQTFRIINGTESMIPYTVSVIDSRIKKSISLPSHHFNNVFTKTTYPKTLDSTTVFLTSVQSTSIRYNPAIAVVGDLRDREIMGITTFNAVTVNVNSKVQVVIPESATGYSDLSIIVQKNSFLEISLPSNVSGVENLPEALSYVNTVIKGTFTKSGEYNIRIKYSDGEQILNIIVPYYQRLL